MNNKIEVGIVVNTHGLRGEVKIVPWLDFPEMFEIIDVAYTESGEKLKVSDIRYQKANVIVKFREIDSVEKAERLKNRVIYADRKVFDNLPEGTYLIADIIGLEVTDGQTVYGRIADVIQTGSNDVYVVKREGEKDLLIPAIKEVILDTDVENGVMTVKLLDGLLDL
jgi:16S rRNA processing protein RimM